MEDRRPRRRKNGGKGGERREREERKADPQNGKSPRERGKSPRERAEKMVNVGLMKVLGNLDRVCCLAVVHEKVGASPAEVSEELGERLSQVSYHMNVLHECGLIELDHTRQVRGAIEHFYKPVFSTLVPADLWKDVPDGVKRQVGIDIMQEIYDDATAATVFDKFERRNGFDVSATPLILDEEGAKRLNALVEGWLKEVDELQAETSERMEGQGKGDEDGISFTVGIMSFASLRHAAEGRKARMRKRCR